MCSFPAKFYYVTGEIWNRFLYLICSSCCHYPKQLQYSPVFFHFVRPCLGKSFSSSGISIAYFSLSLLFYFHSLQLQGVNYISIENWCMKFSSNFTPSFTPLTWMHESNFMLKYSSVSSSVVSCWTGLPAWFILSVFRQNVFLHYIQEKAAALTVYVRT